MSSISGLFKVSIFSLLLWWSCLEAEVCSVVSQPYFFMLGFGVLCMSTPKAESCPCTWEKGKAPLELSEEYWRAVV